MSWEELLELLSAKRYRAAVVGPHGSGKTSCLKQIELHIRECGRPTIWWAAEKQTATECADSWRWHNKVAQDAIVFIDGADALAILKWRLLRARLSRAGGVVISSHREGLLPTIIRCQPTLSLFYELLGDLIPASQFPPDHTLRGLFRIHEGNIRSMFGDLYLLWSVR